MAEVVLEGEEPNGLATMIAGIPLTLRIGMIAGAVGVGVGTVLAFVAAFDAEPVA
jgi:ABC-type dipeptide/oligopeptide/nickel transport system permease subunit